MVKTVLKIVGGIVVTFAFIFGVVLYENHAIHDTFSSFGKVLQALYEKTEAGEVTYEDGTATEEFWEHKKNTLHIWIRSMPRVTEFVTARMELQKSGCN